MVWGNMLHEVMQRCLKENRWDETWLDGLVSEVVSKGLSELVKISIGVEEATREVKSRSKGLKVFAERYMSQMPKVSTNFSFHNN
jgi:DNA replication ATP-dependent helicase Dna2